MATTDGHLDRLGPLPITGSWLVPFTLYMVSRSLRVSLDRIKIARLHRDSSATAPKTIEQCATMLKKRVRAHGNFIENAPSIFILAAVAEVNGGSASVLNAVLAVFLLARVAHAEGFAARDSTYRALGAFGTLSSLVTLASYNGWLVRGYWGSKVPVSNSR